METLQTGTTVYYQGQKGTINQVITPYNKVGFVITCPMYQVVFDTMCMELYHHEIVTSDILLASNDFIVCWKHRNKEIWTYVNDTTGVKAYIEKGPTDTLYSVIVTPKGKTITDDNLPLYTEVDTLQEARELCIPYLQ